MIHAEKRKKKRKKEKEKQIFFLQTRAIMQLTVFLELS